MTLQSNSYAMPSSFNHTYKGDFNNILNGHSTWDKLDRSKYQNRGAYFTLSGTYVCGCGGDSGSCVNLLLLTLNISQNFRHVKKDKMWCWKPDCIPRVFGSDFYTSQGYFIGFLGGGNGMTLGTIP